jgi:hypothetical protein
MTQLGAPGVLQTLCNCGLRGHLPTFVSNFLAERHIQTRVGSCLSAPVTVTCGIPQGSVLSCTCFILAINSIVDTLPQLVKSTLYVDDFTIYSSGFTPRTVERRMQLALNHLQRWSDTTGFTFSPEKTVSMHICRKRGCPKLAHNFTLSTNNIVCVDQYKFLGVIIDNSMTWRQHITALRASCMKSLDLLKHLSHKSWSADRTSLLRLYIMLIKPKLDYGSEVYSA